MRFNNGKQYELAVFNVLLLTALNGGITFAYDSASEIRTRLRITYSELARMVDHNNLTSYRMRMATDFVWKTTTGLSVKGRDSFISHLQVEADLGKPSKHLITIDNFKRSKTSISVRIVERINWKKEKNGYVRVDPYVVFTHLDTWNLRNGHLVYSGYEELRIQGRLNSGKTVDYSRKKENK